MKVLLVQSYLGGSEPPIYPLGLSCISSLLYEHEVKVFDTNISENPFKDIQDIVIEFSPDIIGISLRNIDSTNKRRVVFYYDYLKKTLDVVKALSNAKIIIGGSGFSMFAKEIMKDEPRIDFGIFLEGEITFPKLLQNLNRPEKVKSVFYRREGEIIFSGPGGQVDLNTVSFPDRNLIPLSNYKSYRDAIGIETKRGCILDCIYCIYGFLNGKELRSRDPIRVVDEIETLVKNYGFERFTFVDSVFNIPKKHAEMICNEIIGRGIKVSWSAWFNEKELSRDFVELVRDAGCDNIILSPDGFSEIVLKRLGKNITKKDIIKSYNILKGLDGFEVGYNFFKNPPSQSFLAFISLIIFYIKAKLQMKGRVHFEFNSLRIEPHTRLYRIAIEEGFVKEGANLLYPNYYTNPRTRYIEKFFNALLKLKKK